MSAALKPHPGAAAFRAELLKIMPGYDWTVHKSRNGGQIIEATGTQSGASNHLPTLAVKRIQPTEGKPSYEVKSARGGRAANWAHSCLDRTLARALRQLQGRYEAMARTHHALANDLAQGRCPPRRASWPWLGYVGRRVMTAWARVAAFFAWLFQGLANADEWFDETGFYPPERKP